MSKVEQVEVERALKLFNGGLVDEPDLTNARGHTTRYWPMVAMRTALAEVAATHRALGRAEGYAQCQGEVVAWLRFGAWDSEMQSYANHFASVIEQFPTAIEQSAQGDGG